MRQIKIGLALGAGSAKGWAHIGVINALKKLGIEVDIVAGCSVGALVGAAFASHRLPAMEQWVRSFSYWDVIRLMDFHGSVVACYAAIACLTPSDSC